MTPLEYAEKLLGDLKAACPSSPDMAYAQVGTQVVGCESLIVAVTGTDARELQEGGLRCGYLQIATYVVTLARECAVEFSDDGFDDPVEIKRVSEQMDADGECLWEFASSIDPYITKDFSVGYTITGGLAITSLQITLGVI